MSEQGEDDKQYEPSQKKLDDARKKGEIPRSTDLNTAAAYGGFVLVAMASGAPVLLQLGSALKQILAQSPNLASDIFSGGSQALTGSILTTITISVSPWFAAPFVSVIALIAFQKSFLVTPSKLKPKRNRISILANAKNKFGRRGLFEFAKSFVKLIIFSVILGVFLTKISPKLIGATLLAPGQVVSLLAEVSISFISIVVVVIIAVGFVDFMWQKADHTRKNRMSRKDLTDEAKQMEGDPFIKQKRRQKAQEIAMNQMLADVPSADVIVVNPEHYAIALKWSRAAGSAPVCVAKGKGEIAARIREAAHEYAVPIHRDPPTARALFSTVDIGEQIHPEHFKAVAAAIRFAEEMQLKASKQDGRP